MPPSPSSPSNDQEPGFSCWLHSDLNELLTNLHHSHTLYYKMINLEVWALVETLDQFSPGCWDRFMKNREVAVGQFEQHQQNHSSVFGFTSAAVDSEGLSGNGGKELEGIEPSNSSEN